MNTFFEVQESFECESHSWVAFSTREIHVPVSGEELCGGYIF